jgi:C1A family cysteine protease
MLLIGYVYKSEENKRYWILKNSWGNNWGINGNVYFEMDEEWDACGMYRNIVEFD